MKRALKLMSFSVAALLSGFIFSRAEADTIGDLIFTKPRNYFHSPADHEFTAEMNEIGHEIPAEKYCVQMGIACDDIKRVWITFDLGGVFVIHGVDDRAPFLKFDHPSILVGQLRPVLYLRDGFYFEAIKSVEDPEDIVDAKVISLIKASSNHQLVVLKTKTENGSFGMGVVNVNREGKRVLGGSSDFAETSLESFYLAVEY